MKVKKEDIKVEIEGEITDTLIREYNEELAKVIVEEMGIKKSKSILDYIEKEYK